MPVDFYVQDKGDGLTKLPMSPDNCLHAKYDAGSPHQIIVNQCEQAIVDADNQRVTHVEQCQSYGWCGHPTSNVDWTFCAGQGLKGIQCPTTWVIYTSLVWWGWSTLIVTQAMCTSSDHCGNPWLVSARRCLFMLTNVSWLMCIGHNKCLLADALGSYLKSSS